MDGRSHYYVLVRFRSPVTRWPDVIIHPVPDAHLDTCVNGYVQTCGKITIKFPDCHYHGGLLAVCDTVCHPVTPPKCPGSCDSGYSRSNKYGGRRVLLAGSSLSTIFWFFGGKIHVQANMASCVLGHPKLFPAPQNNLPLAWRLGKGSTPKSLRLKAEKQEQKIKISRFYIQTDSQEMGTVGKGNEPYSCFQSIANRIFSSYGTV